MFWNKKDNPEHPTNVYDVLENELERLHDLLNVEMRRPNNSQNCQSTWKRIVSLQDKLMDAVEKQPSNEEAIRDLQNTVCDMLITGDSNGQ